MADDTQQKTMSETVKNYVTAFAILVGGGWTVYEFASLGRVERTHLELAIAEEELKQERSVNLREALKEPTLQIEIETENYIDENGNYVVIGDVRLKNLADIRVDVPLDPEKSTLQIFRFEERRGNPPVVVDRQVWQPRDHVGPVAGVTILPGRTVSLPFVFWVDEPGVYLLSFQAEAEEAASVQDVVLREKYALDKILWSETRLIRVVVGND